MPWHGELKKNHLYSHIQLLYFYFIPVAFPDICSLPIGLSKLQLMSTSLQMVLLEIESLLFQFVMRTHQEVVSIPSSIHPMQKHLEQNH